MSLYQPAGLDLGAHLRLGASDAALAGLLEQALSAKRSHRPSQATPRVAFSMADLGG